ncbi:hypothetical protein EMIT053CA3_30220 [Pseudomonas donghuensis]
MQQGGGQQDLQVAALLGLEGSGVGPDPVDVGQVVGAIAVVRRQVRQQKVGEGLAGVERLGGHHERILGLGNRKYASIAWIATASRSSSRPSQMCRLYRPHRWQTSSHSGSVFAGLVGAGLARDRARSGRNPDTT